MKKEFDKARAPGGLKYDESIDLSPENWVGLNLNPLHIADYGMELLSAFGIGPAMPPEWRDMDENVWQAKAETLQQDRGLIGLYIRDRELAYKFLSREGRDGYAEKEIWRALDKEFGEQKPQAGASVVLGCKLPANRF